MVHPAIIGSIVAVAVVGTIAVLLYIEERNRTHYAYETLIGVGADGKGDHDSDDESEDEDKENENGRPGRGWSEVRDPLWEKFGMRRRKSKKASSRGPIDMEPVNSRESELQDQLSYMNAMEQEIERKQQALSREQAFLAKQEDEIRARRQQIQSLGNSVTGVPLASPPLAPFPDTASTDTSPFASASVSTVLPALADANLDTTPAHEEQQAFTAMWSDREGSPTPSAPSIPHSLHSNPLEDSVHSNLTASSHLASFHTSSVDHTPSVLSGTNSFLSPEGHTNPLMGPDYFHSQTQLRVPSSVGSWSDVGVPGGFGLVAPHADSILSHGSEAGGSGIGGYGVSSTGGSPSLIPSELGSEDFIEVESLESGEDKR